MTTTPVNPHTDSATVDPDRRMAAARRVLEEAFPNDDEATLRELLTEDFVNHEAPPDVPPGPESAIYFMHLLSRAFSEQQWTIEKAICDGDTVALYCTHSGRHTGDFFGLPATDRRFSYRQMHMVRMRGDRGAEHWAVRDDAALRQQLTGASA